MEEMQKNSL